MRVPGADKPKLSKGVYTANRHIGERSRARAQPAG